MATRTEYQHGEFSWVNLGTTDPASAKRFYGGLFGWQFNDMPAGPGMTYTFCELKRQSVGGLYALPEELQSRGVPSHPFHQREKRRRDCKAGAAKRRKSDPWPNRRP